ncbi:SH3 domain-binding protein 5-like [Rhincodon typus]|uniref:SH3 domain-binding protein 5-like n=1 Tax=Rhincodon typus TaxID=259920 RepID=UPI00202F0BC7|nr:SH3 domain-binding protein 5-like [Rhincodon typus]
MGSPILGPRSECSGASSPECETEKGDRAEDVESEDKLMNQQSIDEATLEIRVTQISVKCTEPKEKRMSELEVCGLAPSPTC